MRLAARLLHYFARGTVSGAPRCRASLRNKGARKNVGHLHHRSLFASGGNRRAHPEGYRFFAATHRFNPLEGQLFRNAREAERAAIRLASGGLKLMA